MTLISTGFLAFFLAVFLLYFFAPRKAQPAVLLAASLLFYGSQGLSFLLVLIVEIGFVYVCALWIEKFTGFKRKRILLLSLLGVLSPLIVFKYLNFVIQSVYSFFHSSAAGKSFLWLSLILPIGISFYTLKSVSYLLDVYYSRIQAEKNPILLGLYISFFPQILAGPIERSRNFLCQFRTDNVLNLAHLSQGLKLVTWGIFKKVVIADQLAKYVNIIFDRPQDFPDLSLIFGLIFYSFQIYCDFSGYSDMAIGLAKILGIDSMENFHYPYFSRSVVEFWSRWHISLSTWLRDYLFLPITYALSRKIRVERFLLVKTEFFMYFLGVGMTMLLCGLWHGAGWTFVVWGGVHGFYLIFSRATKKVRYAGLKWLHLRKDNAFLDGWKKLSTFFLVTLAWVFFRSTSLANVWLYLRNISFRLPQKGVGQLLFFSSLLVVFLVAEALMKNKDKIRFLKKIPGPIQVIAYALFLCLIIILAADTSNEFLYFRF